MAVKLLPEMMLGCVVLLNICGKKCLGTVGEFLGGMYELIIVVCHVLLLTNLIACISVVGT